MKRLALLAIGLAIASGVAFAEEREPTMWISINGEVIVGCLYSESSDDCASKLSTYPDAATYQMIVTSLEQGQSRYCVRAGQCVDVLPGDTIVTMKVAN